MTEQNEEAAVNAMAAQVVYGDDDLRRDMREFILETVARAFSDGDPRISTAASRATWDQTANFILVNKAREIEKIVARYLTNKMSGDQY